MMLVKCWTILCFWLTVESSSANYGCNTTLTSVPSHISSPLYPSKYPNSVICNYLFKHSKRSGYYTSIYFYDFQIENSEACKADSLSLYGGNSTSAPLIDKLCGSKIPRRYVVSGNSIFLQFTANSRLSGRGFKAVAESIYTDCGQTFRSPGSLYSPNYPSKYPRGISCHHVIKSSYGSTIILEMQHFDLEWSENCKKDNLKIYEGSISKETLMSTRCGNDTTMYFSRTSTIHLLFSTDLDVAKTGYLIQFTTCGGYHLPQINQYTIKSPFYPDTYRSNSMCRYELQGQFSDFGIRLEFELFELESSHKCQYDKVAIYEGFQQSITDPVDIKCGLVRGDFISQSQNLTMIFRSNSQVNGKGFIINVDSCSKLFTNDSGIVTSPGFPSSFSEDMFCTYAIRLRKGAKVQIAFQNFSLNDRGASSLMVYNGKNAYESLAATMTGHNYKNILATGNEVYMEFHSYKYVKNDTTWYGFKLMYFNNQELCSKELPCKNNGTCIDISGDYQCKCSLNYTGKNCSEKIIPCSSNPCFNGGVCSDIYSHQRPTFNCTCFGHYFGRRCEKNHGLCAINRPCRNNSTCTDLSEKSYTCNCTIDYTGKNCSDKIIPCKSNPCLNGGLCSNIYTSEPPNFNCICLDHYVGKRCEQYLGLCSEYKPCKNDARCIDHSDDSYRCNCTVDYTGKNCSEKIIPCASNPCRNDGVCKNLYSDQLLTFNCTCLDHYNGTTCESIIGSN